MQTVFVSVIVYDSSDLRISISPDKDAIRRDLIEYYNEFASQEDEPFSIGDDTSLDEVLDLIRSDLGYSVVVEENCVWDPAEAVAA